MGHIKSLDFLVIDRLFGMEGGFVLNFSDRTFAQFFAEELAINIGDPKYSVDGGSKAKRLRCFLRLASQSMAAKTLNALWDYRKVLQSQTPSTFNFPDAESQYASLLARVEGRQAAQPTASQEKSGFDPAIADELKSKIMSLNSIAPHERGYKFELFLKRLFDSYGLNARQSFRLRGEQIDGSFDFGNSTYLMEAKLHSSLTGVADLHIFHGKIEQKADWSRGLFISYTGFTPDGLYAFGKGKRIICMDGRDIFEMLDRKISFTKVLEGKVRRAAETGEILVRMADLFEK